MNERTRLRARLWRLRGVWREAVRRVENDGGCGRLGRHAEEYVDRCLADEAEALRDMEPIPAFADESGDDDGEL
jgi:hypothetical protein